MRGAPILAASVVMAITVVGIVGLTMMSGGGSPAQPQVVRDNVTVTGKMAMEVTCGAFAIDCPVLIASVDNIQLIKYQGDYYYVRHASFGTDPGPATTTTSTQADGRVVTTISAGQPQSTLEVTLWFTNSTVYCISPADGPGGGPWPGNLPTCPE